MAPTTRTSLWQEIADRGVPSIVAELSDAEAVQMTERYGAHNYKPLPVNIVRADGAEAWDGSGKRYIDCVGAYSAVAHGHLSERVVEAIKEQLERLSLTSRAFYTSEVALFMKGLAEYCGLDMVCPMNTGAEAVETCIKLARKWAYTVKGVPKDQAEILVCEDNFHGRTTTIVGFSTEPGYKANFGPFTPGFKVIPFGNIEALRAAITPNTAAFMAEPIQAEGGIIIPPEGWMAEVAKLCRENRVLLIWDEVQTGFCRTGRRFAWQYEDAEPDLVAVGKPLGGGIMPVSAAVGKAEVMEVFHPGDHGSTFGGNPLGAVVALTALAEMEAEDFAGQAVRAGTRFTEGLLALQSPHIKEVRSRGLLVGMEVSAEVDTAELTHQFLHHGVLTKETRHRTFRFTPPIVITDEQVDEAVDRVGKSLAALP
ncbi:MAG: ornithine--oxo-acid transaminase [Fimbriimonadaceae bacterium]|nr:ornithine--oxo-acid transaminase [Fimbriimonadaceae bacterium]QYK55604.1 MAG: ornithine--oxo-acid transaminase [Fimbriimonadaceae bacterium]